MSETTRSHLKAFISLCDQELVSSPRLHLTDRRLIVGVKGQRSQVHFFFYLIIYYPLFDIYILNYDPLNQNYEISWINMCVIINKN